MANRIAHESGIEVSLTSEDTRYPLINITNGVWSHGYHINPNDGTLTQVCICDAHCSSECVCGIWDGDSNE